MASRKIVRTPGHEPAKGFPNPAHVPSVIDRKTHYPHAQGPVCGVRPTPTDARDYDVKAPTCDVCAGWLRSAQGNTAARHPHAVARTQARLEAEHAAETPKE